MSRTFIVHVVKLHSSITIFFNVIKVKDLCHMYVQMLDYSCNLFRHEMNKMRKVRLLFQIHILYCFLNMNDILRGNHGARGSEFFIQE